jgi:hypothetical protein
MVFDAIYFTCLKTLIFKWFDPISKLLHDKSHSFENNYAVIREVYKMAKYKDIFFIMLLILPFSIYLLPLNQSSYYPMAIGNEWEFNSDFDPHSDIIGDTARINNKLYYGFGRSSDVLEYWLREENQTIYCLNPADSMEFVLFDFTIEIGDSIELPTGYECSFGTKVFLVGTNDTIVTSAGIFYNCIHFKHMPKCDDAGIHDTWFSEDVGKVKYIAEYIAGIQEFALTNYKIPTSINSGPENHNITTCQLYQNYPNPFNPETNIEFYLSEKNNVALKVLNMLGQTVAILIDEDMSMGNHTIKFNGQNLNSGVYFYKLKVGGYQEVKKMILLQ